LIFVQAMKHGLIQDKEIDTLKTQIDLKELEIDMLKKKHEL
jgi:hypothetical protein